MMRRVRSKLPVNPKRCLRCASPPHSKAVLECGGLTPLWISARQHGPLIIRSNRIPPRLWTILVFFIITVSAICTTQASSISRHTPPHLQREFRAAWIAVMANIDWPSKPGLSTEQQKAELRALIEKAAELRLNVIFFQVRPACDAVYKSTIEPWSEFLEGEMGKAPSPFFDPLEFAINEAHGRGIELHAWFNPYRAGIVGRKLSANHIRREQPRLVRTYGKYLWLDPGEQAVQDYTTKVILDVVRRYDIDGVHLDDYFYPYPDAKAGDFPDQPSWNRYRTAGGKMDRADWRRENVNKLVRRLQSEVHEAKPWVTFGISPFGIWRPGYPPQIKGLDAYGGLYADARLWLAKGWVDYLSPQLYWTIDAKEQSYPVLLKWWRDQSSEGRPVWPGGAVRHASSSGVDEIINQIEFTRESGTPGYVHWSLGGLVEQSRLQKALLKNLYAEPALVPGNYGDGGSVIKPAVKTEKEGPGKLMLRWSVPAKQTVSHWVVQIKRGSKWETRIVPARTKSELFYTKNIDVIAISAVSRYRNLSPAELVIP